MKSIFAAAMAVSLVGMSHAAILYQWNFNSVPSDGSTQTGTDVANIAILGGSAISRVGLGSNTTLYTAGTGSTDPAADSDDTAYHTTAYPAQGQASGTAGIQVKASTVGYKNVKISFDRRGSASASRWQQLQYTIDGTNYIPFQNYEIPGITLTMVNGSTADLSSVPGVINNPNFGFRIVAIFGIVGAPTGTSYATIGNTSPGNSTYSVNGTMRYDMVTIEGAAVPEPGSILAIATGAAVLIRRRRK